MVSADSHSKQEQLPALFRTEKTGTKLKNLRTILATPAGCPWDTLWDKQESTIQCPRDFLFLINTLEELAEKGHFAGKPAGSQGHPAVQGVSRSFM